MAVEGQRTGIEISLERAALSVALFIGIASFCVGFLLREDSIGGARFDYYFCHWPLIQRFSTMPWGAAAADSCASNNPLLYIVFSLMPLHANEKVYHLINLLIALLIWLLLSWAYYRRYSNYRVDWLWASFGASAVLISPTFRSSAFWGTTDYLPLAFCAGTSLLLSRFQDSERGNTRGIGPFTLVAVAALSSCAFYTRQLYAFLPIIAAWIVLTRTRTFPALVLGIFFVTALPEMYLVYLWKGINPPTMQGVFHPAMINVLRTGAVVGLLSTPIIVGCLRRSLSDVLPEWWGTRSTVVAFAGLLAFVVVLGATELPESGGGIIVKAGSRMGAFGTPFILAASYIGLVISILFSVSSRTNAVLAGAYLVPLFVAAFTYQHYLEPSLVVALFLFADTPTAKIIFNKRTMICNFVFTALLLTISIIYYDYFLSVTNRPVPIPWR